LEKEQNGQLKAVRKEYLELERTSRAERDCLQRVIQAYGSVVAIRPELAAEVDQLRGLMAADGALPLEALESELSKLRDKILTLEKSFEMGADGDETPPDLRARLMASCRTIRKIMLPLLDDFYPLNQELEDKAEGVSLDCTEPPSEDTLAHVTEGYLAFASHLKNHISHDFEFVNRTFLSLLDQVKELEQSLASEFGGQERLKEIEYFEMKVNSEMGSIVRSFNVHATVMEIKSTVMEKIHNIKRLVTLKKKEDMERAKGAKIQINRLKKRIVAVENHAQELHEKAEQFQTAAERDGLTGLYNRAAFDDRIREALDAFDTSGLSFALVLFDVDRFKEINDSLGHIAGDKVLQKVAECLKETFRKDDFIARFGGDEFAVVIQNLTMDMARDRILMFRKNLKKRRFTSYARGDINISASAGIALAKEGDTAESLVDRADKVMYASKKGG
jgi:diguanylate cyclase (GGDEF)-like protein